MAKWMSKEFVEELEDSIVKQFSKEFLKLGEEFQKIETVSEMPAYINKLIAYYDKANIVERVTINALEPMIGSSNDGWKKSYDKFASGEINVLDIFTLMTPSLKEVSDFENQCKKVQFIEKREHNSSLENALKMLNISQEEYNELMKKKEKTADVNETVVEENDETLKNAEFN